MAIGVGLIVALLSITAGVKKTANQLIHVGRSDFGLFQQGASDLTRSILPQSLVAKVKSEPGVADAAQIFIRVGSVEDQDEFLLFGFGPGEFADRRNVVIAGRRAHGREAMLGDEAAKELHLGPGDLLHVGKRAFPIAGVYHSGDRFVDLSAILPLPVVQSLAQRPHEITTIGVTVEPGADAEGRGEAPGGGTSPASPRSSSRARRCGSTPPAACSSPPAGSSRCSR